MRRACFAVVAWACGAAPAAAPTPPTPPTPLAHLDFRPPAPLDPIQTLSQTHDETSWILPGKAWLDLGDAPIPPAGNGDQIAADVLEERGHQVRVGVRLPNARFAIWVNRYDLLGVIVGGAEVRDAFAQRAGIDDGVVHVKPAQRPLLVLHGGARVQQASDFVRYEGALEVSGAIDERAIARRGRVDAVHTHVPPAAKTVMVTPGTAIRVAPRWDARVLATVATAYFLTDVNERADGWTEVEYDDSDVYVHGFIHKTDPPSPLHRHRAPPIVPLEATVPLPNGSCLYAHEGGEPIGFIAGDQLGVIQTGVRAGWFAVSFETPWGVITFAARGSSETELEKCGSISGP